MRVKPKKHLGQHFLTDLSIAERIVSLLSGKYNKVLEVGPGMGVLTNFLLKKEAELSLIDIDSESIVYLKNHFPSLKKNIIEGDFLQLNLADLFKEPFALIGNFPYNISTQIMFKVLDTPELIPEVIGMFQMEVAKRIASPPGSRDYGILSVLFQSYYDVEYCFTVGPEVFDPPPQVKSGVIHCQLNPDKKIQSERSFFIRVVKTAFNQRRKTLRNSLKPLNVGKPLDPLPFLEKRPEQLSWQQFDELAIAIKSL